MTYNKNYNRDPGRYNKENRRPRFNIKLAIWVLVLLGVLYAIIFHGSEIRGMIAELIGNQPERVDNTVAVDNSFNDSEEKKRMINIFSEKDERVGGVVIEENEKDSVAVEETEAKEQEVLVVERPAKQTALVENKPASEKTEDYSKHELENFVGQDNGKYGVQDLETKKILIEPTYDRIKDIRQGLQNPYFVVCKNQLWGVVNIKDEVIVPIEHKYINEYVYKRNEIYLELSKEGAGGSSLQAFVRMPEGKIVVPFKYGSVTRLTNDYRYFEVKENVNERNSGVVDQNNKLILPIEYAAIETTIKGEGYAIISKFIPKPDDGCTYYLNGLVRLTDGKIVVPVEYQELEILGPVSFIKAKKDGLYGCINDKNEVIVPFQKVTGVGPVSDAWDNSKNKIRFTLPNGDKVTYGTKGQRVSY